MKKTTKFIKKVKPFVIPATIFTGGAYVYGKTPMARKSQNMKIEMQKIDKERLAGKKFTRKEIIARLDKAKKSKRKFTYFGFGE